MFGRDHRIGLYNEVDRLHDLADALEKRLDGDRAAFGVPQVLSLVRTALHVQDSLTAIEALQVQGSVIPLDTRRATRAEETR